MDRLKRAECSMIEASNVSSCKHKYKSAIYSSVLDNISWVEECCLLISIAYISSQIMIYDSVHQNNTMAQIKCDYQTLVHSSNSTQLQLLIQSTIDSSLPWIYAHQCIVCMSGFELKLEEWQWIIRELWCFWNDTKMSSAIAESDSTAFHSVPPITNIEFYIITHINVSPWLVITAWIINYLKGMFTDLCSLCYLWCIMKSRYPDLR